MAIPLLAMLIPYDPTYFKVLTTWITDEDVLFQYAGTSFSYPFTEQQLLHYQRKYPDRKFYMGLHPDQTPFAFGEIVPQDVYTVRLARILVGEVKSRGKGLGESFLRALLTEARQRFRVISVDLFVLADNAAAIRCYSKAGFTFADYDEISLTHKGREHPIRRMRLRL
jgi:RimJ/RimL family protein N-acetyltransferase